MKRSITILILFASSSLFGQYLHLGSKVTSAFSNVELVPMKIEFSNTLNETDYINGISEQRTTVLPSFLTLTYQSKNRLSVYFDLYTYRHSFIYDLSIEPAAYFADLSQFALQINTGYLATEMGFGFDLLPGKLIKPFISGGINQSILLTLSEKVPDSYIGSFTQMNGRQIRNSIIYNEINQFNNQLTSISAGFGIKYYNVYLKFNYTKSFTEIDLNRKYQDMQIFSIAFGVNLLSLEMVKNQNDD